MKTKQKSGSNRQRARRRRFVLEALEPRVVLDAGLGAEVAPVAATAPGFEQFESVEDLQQFLVDAAVNRWQHLFGNSFTQGLYPPSFIEGDPIYRLPGPRATLDTVGNAVLADGSFDGTNIQVQGVDEADLVKSDGEYLYIANAGRLSIIDARDPAALSLASEIMFDSPAGDLFVSGDRLVLVSSQYSFLPYEVAVDRGAWIPEDDFGAQTSLAIYDIADRTAPALIQETTIDGNLTASRRIDDVVYLVTSDQLHLPRPTFQCEAITTENRSAAATVEVSLAGMLVVRPPAWPELWPLPWSESCVYETEEEYLARIADGLIELAMPAFETIDSNGEVIASGIVSEPTDTYKPLTGEASSVTSIAVIDLSTEKGEISASTSLITDASSIVYASAQNIYIANHSYDTTGYSSTTLQQFAIGEEGTTVDLAAVGTVPGWLVNQFGIDEHGGYLRVVTSDGWGSERTNRLFVLEQLDTNLDVVGSIDEIATGETVFAVRFVGDKAFVVTFRVVDPLFTIDLSDPTQPVIAGELEIPGFSNYLQPISEDFVIGLGRDEGDFGSSPQLSLFDVTDFSSPTRVDKFVFQGTTWSEAFSNHHAISYFPDSQIAVIPFQGFFGLCLDVAGLGACPAQSGNAFWVIQIDTTSADKSLQSLGRIEHDEALLRSLRIGENLFTVSANNVKVTELLHPDTLIDELYYGRIAVTDYVTIDDHDREIELDVLSNDHVEDDATIVEVSATATGAVVEISEDGKRLLYTPAASSDAAHDTFQYVVESGGRRETETVQIYIRRESVRDRMVRLAKADLANRLGIEDAPHQIQLVSVTERQWPDSCLGVASEADDCAQVVTPGFEIALEYAATEFLYHTDTTERVVPANEPVVETGDLILMRAEVVNAAGESVTTLLVGEQAMLQIRAEDLRVDMRGVFAAYFDVLFDPALVAEIGPIDHGTEFIHGKSGTIDDNGLIDEVGGFNREADPSRTLFVSIPIVAAAPGELRFTLEAADESPVHDSLLLGLDSPIPHDRIRFGEVVVEVIESLHNDADPMDANMDGEMTALDALVIINHLNRYGAGPVNAGAASALRAAAAEAHAVRFAADVNRDGFISPIDVLLIVNALDERSEAVAEGESVAAAAAPASSTSAVPDLVTAAVELQAASPFPAPRRTAVSPSMDLEELFVSSSDTIDFVACTLAHRATPSEGTPNQDTFFAELESEATDDWWQN